ncbi:protein-glutamate methylesterase/protein-glutamine glutaminase [Pseudoalteromonas tunicata]|uniref:Protein-glutamate methylesterase/protein-glutamine glutaminase n=1 Tax=Pseudoalteromonas tunicata D2 TaxID=87626 RepID=A4CEV5_9GAMM|nr:chemotaxis response regulator protein-glutamate methylesterase [Pseudoalteromonas tunicata]ATC96096.1 two-component system, chemotaxis family, response regulator CheB [Pseudoalteromonas tunicata]AXT31619.1 chemotaxis response regulator protein-glutamate methylesterase [Pseudoalteromonas tunicata]EAR26834.1 chemotaxis-specific methylesterase [Pseudoalteromonas tunicata D2]MDP4982672.1 chemotaxis response regulator protein-glutamate methylesterase [Pseudoalteromonas tunicata]MDP5213245.1 chem
MIKVLIVDDSPLIRALLTEVLQQAHDIKVVGVAEDPLQARELIKALNPDVITLDVEMPKMDGISFLKNLMRLRPMPVVMVSTLTQEGAPTTLEALELGAVDFVAKPTKNVTRELQAYAEILHDKVRAASQARVRAYNPPHTSSHANKVNTPDAIEFNQNALIAIGASTGGTEAIKEVLIRLPAHFPPVVITQHIPPVFSASFAERMDRISKMNVKEAEDGDVLQVGCVYIAPGDYHLRIEKLGARFVCRLDQGPAINRHRPAVDALFDSIVEIAAKRTIAIVLTGMGADGAKGLLNLKQAGAKTFAQDEKTSVVWGMPRAAMELGAADKAVPLEQVADVLMRSVIKR